MNWILKATAIFLLLIAALRGRAAILGWRASQDVEGDLGTRLRLISISGLSLSLTYVVIGALLIAMAVEPDTVLDHRGLWIAAIGILVVASLPGTFLRLRHRNDPQIKELLRRAVS